MCVGKPHAAASRPTVLTRHAPGAIVLAVGSIQLAGLAVGGIALHAADVAVVVGDCPQRNSATASREDIASLPVVTVRTGANSAANP